MEIYCRLTFITRNDEESGCKIIEIILYNALKSLFKNILKERNMNSICEKKRNFLRPLQIVRP
jgi:hypothetical protein